jgi:hypothetical protein
MSKRITTRWYIGAWVVAFVAAFVGGLVTRASGSTSPSPTLSGIVGVIVIVAGLVMLVMWIGALIRLGQLRAWGWFAGVLISHLVFLGIIGMLVYALAGPDDRPEVVMRPTTT